MMPQQTNSRAMAVFRDLITSICYWHDVTNNCFLQAHQTNVNSKQRKRSSISLLPKLANMPCAVAPKKHGKQYTCLKRDPLPTTNRLRTCISVILIQKNHNNSSSQQPWNPPITLSQSPQLWWHASWLHHNQWYLPEMNLSHSGKMSHHQWNTTYYH
jgi:hypothetical protein